MERKRASLESQFGSLVRKRQFLLLHNAILTAWCDALTLVQASDTWLAAPANPAATAAAVRKDDEAVRERFQQLLTEEIRLLNELTARDKFGVFAVGSAAAALPDPGPDTLSPGDPMSRFRTVRSSTLPRTVAVACN